jgi:hypothetical protein
MKGESCQLMNTGCDSSAHRFGFATVKSTSGIFAAIMGRTMRELEIVCLRVEALLVSEYQQSSLCLSILH